MFVSLNWSVASQVNAIYTNRLGGVSEFPYDSFNLATHVDDDMTAVMHNRNSLMTAVPLPSQPFWLDQQHTQKVVYVGTQMQSQSSIYSSASENAPAPVLPVADASWTDQPGQVLAVMTADCLPVLLATKQGDKVAAVHAGWRGLAKGIISQTIKAMGVTAADLQVWIGPSISQRFFEVGKEVKKEFEAKNPNYAQAFELKNEQTKCKYMADLPAIAQMELEGLGVNNIKQSHLCTYADKAQFFSYRRDGQTGRIASLIWINPVPKSE